MQHRLKPAARSTWTRIVAAELLDELDIAMHDAIAALHVPLRRDARQMSTVC
jgi:hypothetical protein